MDDIQLKKIWLDKFKIVPENLIKLGQVESVATAFNANIDAVLKISSSRLEQLIKKENLSLKELLDIKQTKLNSGKDVVKGIFKSFSRGIAEEWLTEDKNVYNWMVENLGYDRLQMGGQGGIVANVMAVAGVKKVLVHTNSLPKLQAQQFVSQDNLVSFDENGEEKPAYLINRKNDTPLIHWIIEYDKGDILTLEGQTFECPKSNRFIATYDPLNLNLVMDKNFVDITTSQKNDYVVLSGFHALTANNAGVELFRSALPIVKKWMDKGAIVHLEVASTQDVKVREAIIKEAASMVDSIGVNERETIDILEVIGEKDLAQKCEKDTHSVNLFKGLVKIKQKIKCPRIQMHMFGLYITIQDKDFSISPQANLNGMMTAATVAAGKAGTGSLNSKDNLLWAQGREVSEVGLKELSDLSDYIKNSELLKTGISSFSNYDVIAVPTILVEKPLTLVGMGDTISSISLISSF